MRREPQTLWSAAVPLLSWKPGKQAHRHQVHEPWPPWFFNVSPCLIPLLIPYRKTERKPGLEQGSATPGSLAIDSGNLTPLENKHRLTCLWRGLKKLRKTGPTRSIRFFMQIAPESYSMWHRDRTLQRPAHRLSEAM